MVSLRKREVDFDYDDGTGEDPYRIYYDGSGNLVVEHKTKSLSWKFTESGLKQATVPTVSDLPSSAEVGTEIYVESEDRKYIYRSDS